MYGVQVRDVGDTNDILCYYHELVIEQAGSTRSTGLNAQTAADRFHHH